MVHAKEVMKDALHEIIDAVVGTSDVLKGFAGAGVGIGVGYDMALVANPSADLLWVFICGALGALGAACMNRILIYLKKRFFE